MGTLACLGGRWSDKKKQHESVMAARAFRQEKSGGPPREVSVKVGRPTRSSFSFSKLRANSRSADILTARDSSLDPPGLGIHPDGNVLIIPNGRRARENCSARSRACGINILPNLRPPCTFVASRQWRRY